MSGGELVPVEQCDRDAAADLVRWQRSATAEWQQGDGDEAWQFFVPGFSRGIIQGIWDEHYLVQAFAAHRLAARTPTPREQALAKALEAIVAFCDDPNGSEQPESLALGLARLLPDARRVLSQTTGDQP